jgi:hypothetical protein
MLGVPIRDRLRLYWSHCGTYRLHHAQKIGVDSTKGWPIDHTFRHHRKIVSLDAIHHGYRGSERGAYQRADPLERHRQTPGKSSTAIRSTESARLHSGREDR